MLTKSVVRAWVAFRVLLLLEQAEDATTGGRQGSRGVKASVFNPSFNIKGEFQASSFEVRGSRFEVRGSKYGSRWRQSESNGCAAGSSRSFRLNGCMRGGGELREARWLELGRKHAQHFS